MRTKILASILFIFYSLVLIGQDCSFSGYYSLIDSAQISFKEKEYERGKEFLKSAFSTNVFPKGKDLSYALYKARENKDDAWAVEIAEKLVKGGVPKRFFFQFKKEGWYPRFEKEFQNNLKYYLDNFNNDLRQDLLLLLIKDSKRTDRYHKWRTREIEMSLDDLINSAKEILSDFEQLIIKYGFPYEKLIGYNYDKRTNKIKNYEIDILFIHFYQRGVRIFEDSIPELICSGGLPPDFESTINKITGFSSCYGIENEMKARYKKYRDEEE